MIIQSVINNINQLFTNASSVDLNNLKRKVKFVERDPHEGE